MDLTPSEAVDPDLPRTWIQPNYRSFNGLRAMAVLAVFLTHFGYLWGWEIPQLFLWSGVDLFFVLSGFLITGILYDSLKSPHYFRDFYVRRALRIFPLFYALFLLLLLLTPILHLEYVWKIWTFPLYVGNLFIPLGFHSGHDISAIYKEHHGVRVPVVSFIHFWSLCVEGQFYLLWPAVIWWVRDRKRLMQLCVVLCVLVLPVRFTLHQVYNLPFLVHVSTYTRFDTLLVGAWMALWLRGRALSLRQLRRISLLLFSIPGVLIVVMILRFHSLGAMLVQRSRFVSTVGFTLFALSYAGLILRSLDDSSRVSRLLRLRPLHALGTISYGFYVVHFLIADGLAAFARTYPSWAFVGPILGFVFTAGVATLSYRYLETPFLRLKRVLAPQHAAPDAATPAHLHVSEPAA